MKKFVKGLLGALTALSTLGAVGLAVSGHKARQQAKQENGLLTFLRQNDTNHGQNLTRLAQTGGPIFYGKQ